MTGSSVSVAALPGETLVLDAELTGGNGSVSFPGSNGGGTVILPHANTYSGTPIIQGGTVSISAIGNANSAGNLGTSLLIEFNQANAEARLIYAGTGETNNRWIDVASTQGAAVLDQSGSGLLKISGSVYGNSALTLQGSSSGNGELSGSVGAFQSSLGIIKQGTNTWTLSGQNSYTSATTVENGTLALNYDVYNSSKLSDTFPLVLGTGTLALVGSSGTHTEIVGSTSVDGYGAIARSGGNSATIQLRSITRSLGSVLNLSADAIATTNNLNNAGILPGVFVSGQFAKNTTNSAGGSIVAVPESSYTNVNRLGGAITDGTLLVRIVDGGSSGDVELAGNGTTNIAAFMQSATSGPVSVNIGGANVLRLGSTGVVLLPDGGSPLTFGGGTLTATGSSSELLIDNASTSNSITINSVIANDGSGRLNLGKAGRGTLVLTGSSTYSGTTAITGGTLSVSSLAKRGIASPIGIGNVGLGLIVLDGGTLLYTGSGNTTDRAIQIGSIADGTTGTIDASGTGALTFSSGATVAYGTSGGRRTLQLTGSNMGDNTFAGEIDDNSVGSFGAVSLLKTGSGKWILTSFNSCSGGTHVAEGILQIGNGNFSSASPGADSVSNIVTVDAGASLVFNCSGIILSNPIVGEGMVVKNGTGTLTLFNTNTFSGGLFINAGTIALSSGIPGIGPGMGTGTVTLSNSATVRINSASTTTGLLSSAENASSAMVIGPGQLTVDGSSTQLFAGQISGTLSLLKDGPGTQILTGSNSYSGATSVIDGVLQIGNGSPAGSLGKTPAITVQTGVYCDLIARMRCLLAIVRRLVVAVQ